MAIQAQGGAGSRRGFLRFIAGMAAWVAVWRPVLGAPKPRPAEPGPQSHAFQAALAAALNGKSWTESSELSLEVPQLAENGAIVPITVISHLPNTARLFVFAENNPGPLLARFDFEPGTEGFISLRVKLNESGPVLAIAEAGGGFYGVSKPVKVMVGGCG